MDNWRNPGPLTLLARSIFGKARRYQSDQIIRLISNSLISFTSSAVALYLITGVIYPYL